MEDHLLSGTASPEMDFHMKYTVHKFLSDAGELCPEALPVLMAMWNGYDPASVAPRGAGWLVDDEVVVGSLPTEVRARVTRGSQARRLGAALGRMLYFPLFVGWTPGRPLPPREAKVVLEAYKKVYGTTVAQLTAAPESTAAPSLCRRRTC
jgi:hypothetical protein